MAAVYFYSSGRRGSRAFFSRSYNTGDSADLASSAAHTTALSEDEQYAVSCAQEMVTSAAYDPGSVHFRKSDLSVQFDGSVYTVTQTFDRRLRAARVSRSLIWQSCRSTAALAAL